MAFDPYVSKVNREIKLVKFSQLLSDSDFISIHTPLTDETRHSFGENELKAMKKTAYLINTARGSIIDEEALYRALEKRWITGAALDVMEKEPPDWENLLPNFYSEESYIELKTKIAEAVCSVLKGKLPRAFVNPQVFKRGKIVKRRGFYE